MTRTLPTTVGQDHAAGDGTVEVRLDAARWLGRAMYTDILALGLMVTSLIGLAVELYFAGFYAGGAPRPDQGALALARPGLELLVLILSFAWVSARLVRAGWLEALKGA